MSEENSSDVGVYKTRSALGDITNRVAKRVLVSSSDFKSGDGCMTDVETKNQGSMFAKKVCVRKESPNPCSEIHSLRGNVISGISKIACEIKVPSSSDVVNQIGGEDEIANNTTKLGDATGDCCMSTISAPTIPCNQEGLHVRGDICKDKGLSSEVSDGNGIKEAFESSACVKGVNDHDPNNLNSSKDDYVEHSRLPESQESLTTGLERCIGLKGDGCSNSADGVDLIKSCSCPFCTKAAYIWTDLHYQDMKGRIAALKKSQKEANILVEQSFRGNEPDKDGQGNFNKLTRLESDLTGHWTSLFLRTEDTLVRECSQLEASLFALQDLRENCKTEIESMTGRPVETE